MSNIITFPSTGATKHLIASFIRIGESGHRQLADLHATGVLKPKRVVVDASRHDVQKTLVKSFKDDGAEVVLDTKAAELASIAKISGYVKHAPWAQINDGKPLGPDAFRVSQSHDIFGEIARFAVSNGIDRVLSPSHFLGDKKHEDWLRTDSISCVELRRALDREGGHNVCIDYPLIVQHTSLRDSDFRGNVAAELDGLPFDNLWIRASGFGSNATVAGLIRFIQSAQALHNLGRPIVGDYLGGIVGTVCLAFGAIGGIAHGIGERENFDASSWHKVPKQSNGGGRPTRIYIPGLDRSLTKKELDVLLSAKGSRSLLVCSDRSCCSHGRASMEDHHRRHSAIQAQKLNVELSDIPNKNRPEHFILRHGQLASSTRGIARLNPKREVANEAGVNLDSLTRKLKKRSEDTERRQQALENLHGELGKEFVISQPIIGPLSNGNNLLRSR